MVAYPSFGSPSFSLVVKGLVELHRLIKDGKGDSLEADAVRDALDGPLKALNRTEKERAQWLSEDLYSVSTPTAPTAQRSMSNIAQHRLSEAFEARESHEWDRALALLRDFQDQTAPDLLSYNRGRIWEEAGFPVVATEFFNHAWTINPEKVQYGSLYMQALAESEPAVARKLARQLLKDCKAHDPLLVLEAVSIRFDEANNSSDAESLRTCQELIPILEENLAQIEKDGVSASHTVAYESTLGKLGIFYEFLGNSSAAVTYFSRGLQVNPNNDGLLAARGLLLYGTSPSAITDLERAVELGCPLNLAYLLLGHHYLVTSRFEHCRAICEAGLKVAGSDAAKSQLEEWRAIAQAELGFPPETVRAAFEAAVRLDPSNDLAKRNQEAFEVLLKAPSARLHMKWEQKSEESIRRFGLAEHRYGVAA